MTPQGDAALDPATLRAELDRLEPGAGTRADVRIVRAPGRVNLIGEHTDYNEGFVLPAAIGLETWIASVPSQDRRVELRRVESGETLGFSLDDVGERRGEWIDYVAGTAWALAEAGVATRGVRGVIASTLPISSGLSSSAAIELAAGWTLAARLPPMEPMALARSCQRAENEYVGVASGLMDQFASSLGRHGAALLLDCRSLEYHAVTLPLDSHVIVVCDTGSPRRLERSAYNERRAQCERGVAILAERESNVRSLRDVDEAMLERHRDALDEVIYRRCLHVVRENERVGRFVRALQGRDMTAVGALLAASHESLRVLYEVSSPELDAMVEIVAGVRGVVGTRMTGAGFGGCTVALAERGAIDDVREVVVRDYPAQTGLAPRVWSVDPVDGAGLVDQGA